MATPTFRAVGTAVYTANSVVTPTNLTPTKNAATQNGDLMLCVTASRSNTATVSTPTGWTLLTGFPVTSATASGGKIYVFSRIADGTGNDAPTVTWTGLATGTTGDSASARILAWSNAITTQAGTVPAATDTAATTSWTLPGITTTNPNALAVGISVKISDVAQTTTVTTFTERSDDATQTGTGHVTQVSEKIQTTTGATGSGTVTPSDTTSSRVLAVSLALRAAATSVTAGTPSTVNAAQAIDRDKKATLVRPVLTMSALPLSVHVNTPTAPFVEPPVRAASMASNGRFRTSPSRSIRSTGRGRSGLR